MQVLGAQEQVPVVEVQVHAIVWVVWVLGKVGNGWIFGVSWRELVFVIWVCGLWCLSTDVVGGVV